MSTSRNLQRLDGMLSSALQAARIPGAAVAIVEAGKLIYARGFGWRDLRARKPVTPETLYPIASTSKAINATLLGMLVDEGHLEWDAPVQRYLPDFRVKDAFASPRVTLRDLVTMQTGLPRHDWVWIGNPMSRAELVRRLAHLESCADFRRRFQYSNLTTTASGHLAEIVTGKRWEQLVRERILGPLGMRRTRFAPGSDRNATSSYHETARRRIVPSIRLASEVTAPSGGSIHSTVVDMARWLSFNLSGRTTGRRRLIAAETLARIHGPQVLIGDRPLAGLPADGCYGMGWVIHPYNGQRRIWHGGYIHDVNSSVMLFPEQGIGVVSFTNFGCPMFADVINQHVFDTMMNLTPELSFEKKLAQYEEQISSNLKRCSATPRVAGTRPSHSLTAYVGEYHHGGYGTVAIQQRGGRLIFVRDRLRLPLEHWHFDAWVAAPHSMWTIHHPHPFDRASPMEFSTDARGRIVSLSIRFEPECAPIRFTKRAEEPE
jgi:CubicO group peptidase (beta-lactamase class C family)